MILTESLGVGGIVDGEAGLESDGLAVAPQNAHAGGVEGGDPHALATGPISEPSLSRISAAALLVKVMARIWLGHAPNWLKIQAMRAGQHAGFAGACTGLRSAAPDRGIARLPPAAGSGRPRVPVRCVR